MSDLSGQINTKAAALKIAADARLDGLISYEQYKKVADELLELFGKLNEETSE